MDETGPCGTAQCFYFLFWSLLNSPRVHFLNWSSGVLHGLYLVFHCPAYLATLHQFPKACFVDFLPSQATALPNLIPQPVWLRPQSMTPAQDTSLQIDSGSVPPLPDGVECSDNVENQWYCAQAICHTNWQHGCLAHISLYPLLPAWCTHHSGWH